MKLTKHAWILWGIALAAVLALALVLPFVRNMVYAIALLGMLGMFALCAWTFVRAFRRDGRLESKLLGWPIFKVGGVALAVQLAVGFALMSLSAFCPVWAAVLAEAAVFAVTAVCLTVRDAAREAVTQLEASIPDTTGPWKAIRARAAGIAAATGNPDLRKLAEDIRYADPTPTPIDGDIAQMLEILSSYADAENIRKAFALLEQRKALAKGSK